MNFDGVLVAASTRSSARPIVMGPAISPVSELNVIVSLSPLDSDQLRADEVMNFDDAHLVFSLLVTPREIGNNVL